jgi:hypothetical protein
LYLDKFIDVISSNNPIDNINNNIDFITRNNKDNKNFILCTLDRCDIILYIRDEKNIVGISLLNLEFNNCMYVC